MGSLVAYPDRVGRVAVLALLVSSLISGLVTVHNQPAPAYAAFSISYFQAVAMPTGLVVNPASEKLYVMHDKNFISVMNTSSGKILGKIYFDENYKQRLLPGISLAVNEKTNTLYATIEFSDTLYVIDGDQDKVVSTIKLDGIGHSIAVNSETNRIYVSTGNKLLYVIDGSSEELIATIDIGDHFYLSGDQASTPEAELSVNPETNLIYATNAGHNLISVINGATNTVIANITGLNFPYSVVVNPVTDRLYITEGHQEEITIVNGSTFESRGVIPEVYGGFFDNEGIAINQAGNRLYAISTSGSGIAVIDGDSDRVVNVISTDSRPLDITVDSLKNRVFVTTEYSARISVMYNPEEGPSSRKPPAGIHPIITHVDDSPFQDMEAQGRQLNISYEFYNDGSIEEAGSEVVAIFEIRNEDDVTIFLGWQVVSIEHFASRHVDISWTAQDPGSYWIHNMLISGFEAPQPIGSKSVWGIEMADG